MKNKFQILLLLFTVISFSNSKAQFNIDAQIRQRLEFRDGYQHLQPLNADPAMFISQRTRISFKYLTEQLKITITPQDVRVWGDEHMANMTGVFGDSASLDMFEGFIEAKIKNNTFISAGRQQLVYDNEWLLSARNWNQNGNSADAIVLKTKPLGWNLHFGLAWNSWGERISENFYPSNRLKSLNYLWVNKQISDRFNFSLMHLSTGVTKNDTSRTLYFRHTSGMFGKYKTEHFAADANAYYQTGVNRTGKNVSAFLGAVDIKYILDQFSIGGSIAYLSGNKSVGQNMKTDGLFDILYGARHKFFGFIDYFRNFENDTRQGGLVDYAITFEVKPLKTFSFSNTSHYFQLAQTNALTGPGKNLGFENDFIIKYKAADWCNLELGYCFFLPTHTLKKIQNSPQPKFSQFVYLQCTIRSVIFSQTKEK
jgi:hypothetical protein